MLHALSYDFMQQALAASLLASIACGVIGTLVVVNRLVFLAGGVSHAAYGGVGLAFHYGWPVLPSAIGFSVASSMLMAGVALKRPEKADTAIGVLWAAGMAFGIILIDLTPGYKADLMSFLFGSILAVPVTDLYLMAALDAALLAVVALCHQTLLVTSFDREFAEARGLPVRTAHYLVVGMTAVGVVMLIRVVGLVLVMALLTIPPFIAARSARSLPSILRGRAGPGLPLGRDLGRGHHRRGLGRVHGRVRRGRAAASPWQIRPELNPWFREHRGTSP